MSGKDDFKTPAEVEANAGFKILNDVSAICEDAINNARCLPAEERARIYAEAMARAAGWFGDAPKAEGPKRRSCFDALDEDCGLRLSVFRSSRLKKFVGVRRPDKDHPMHNAHLFEAEDDRNGLIVFRRDGDVLADIRMHVMKTEAESLVCKMFRALIERGWKRKEKRRRSRARKAAEASAPAEQPPAMDLAQFPEDDE